MSVLGWPFLALVDVVEGVVGRVEPICTVDHYVPCINKFEEDLLAWLHNEFIRDS